MKQKKYLRTINTRQSLQNKLHQIHLDLCQTGETQITARLVARWGPGKKVIRNLIILATASVKTQQYTLNTQIVARTK